MVGSPPTLVGCGLEPIPSAGAGLGCRGWPPALAPPWPSAARFWGGRGLGASTPAQSRPVRDGAFATMRPAGAVDNVQLARRPGIATGALRAVGSPGLMSTLVPNPRVAWA
jgi:hypothetical protein